MTGRARPLAAAALALGATAAVCAGAGPLALLPFTDLARAAADTTVAVAFVVDFSGGAGPVAGCVHVPSGTNGYQALADFTAQEQEQAPTYNSSGLLCSINAVPSSGCGDATANGYIYWSYWHGAAGSWQYAASGAFAAVQPGDVEGWRFENPGKANPSDPPPGAAPDYAALCGSVTAPSPTTSAPAPSGGAGPSGVPGASSHAGPAAPGPAAGSPGTAASTAPPSGAAPGSAATRAPTSTSPMPTVPGAGSAASRSRSGAASRSQSLRAVDAVTRPAGDSAVPVALGAGLVALLVGLAVWRWRTRARAP